MSEKALTKEKELILADSLSERTIIPESFYDFDSLRILADTFSFNGYLIFEVSDSEYYANAEYFSCKVYFIDTLDNLSNPYSKYYYIWANGLFYFDNSLRKDGILDENYIEKLSGRYTGNNKLNSSPSFNLIKENSSILNNRFTYYSSSYPEKHFFIFKTHFNALLVQNNLYYWRSDNILSTLSDVKVLIPYAESIPMVDITNEEISNDFQIK